MKAKIITGMKIVCNDNSQWHTIGLRRLKEMGVNKSNLSVKYITHLGRCSAIGQTITLGRVGNVWTLQGCEGKIIKQLYREYGIQYGFKPYYTVEGNKITVWHPSNGKSFAQVKSELRKPSNGKPLNCMTSEEIFNAATTHRQHKYKGHMTWKTALEHSKRMVSGAATK